MLISTRKMHPTRASTNKPNQASKTAREHETLGTKQHKLHDQSRVIRILMKNLILHPRNFVCGYVFTIYLSQYYCKWIGPPLAIMCRVRISVVRVSEKGWKPVRFQAGFQIEYLEVPPRVMPFLKPIQRFSLSWKPPIWILCIHFFHTLSRY
jgi:hypothetical protein